MSGQGGKGYINEDKFLENNITHRFNNFEHPKYLQSGHEFITKLSIIDATFNIGIKELKALI